MKHLKIAALITCLFGLLASSSHAAKYDIELCIIPLKDIVPTQEKQTAGRSRHLFIRKSVTDADGITTTTGLNYQPKGLKNFFTDQAEAEIGNQNYPQALCEILFSTNNASECEPKWSAIVEKYKDHAATNRFPNSENNRYQNLVLNSSRLTQRVLRELECSIPAKIQDKLNKYQSCTSQ